ncbi:MAG: Prevent-host-death protein [Parcubacteria group bacterium GW2011_GWA2_47_16]|nr:MAG: Prevent-host-death protein [Parcubacteria group bacterium GW2011_GWA2_47_16]
MITTTFSAKEAKNNFGRLLDEARHSPVAVEKNGRRVAIVMSVERFNASETRKGKPTHEEIERNYQKLLWQKMEAEADADIKAGRVSDVIHNKKELKQYFAKLRRG